MKGEYETILESGARVVAVSADDLASHERFCQDLGGCPFPLVSDSKLVAAQLYGVLSPDVRRGHRAIFVIDQGGAILHNIPWFQPGNIGQFLEIFEALGAV